MKRDKRKQPDGSMRWFLPTVAGVAAAAAMWACNSRQSEEAVDYSMSLPPVEVTAALDSLFGAIFPDDNGPGGIALVSRDDTLVYRHAYGIADLETGERITDSTVFNLSSASKIFSAVAIMRLVEQNLISLDDTVTKYFPELPYDIFGKITIRHILTQSSGLPDLRPRSEDEWKEYVDSHHTIYGTASDYRLYGSDKEHMQIFAGLKSTLYPIGEHFQNADPGYIMLAPLVEQVTGRPFAEWMEENIFRPYGLDNTFYLSPMRASRPMAHGYRHYVAESKLKSYHTPDYVWEEFDYGERPFFLTRADKGVNSSAADFMKWKTALYNGHVISDSSLGAIGIGYIVTDVSDTYFGLGASVRYLPDHPTKTFHLSDNGGFSVADGTWPEKRLHYIVLSNRNDWNTRTISDAIDSIFIAKGWI